MLRGHQHEPRAVQGSPLTDVTKVKHHKHPHAGVQYNRGRSCTQLHWQCFFTVGQREEWDVILDSIQVWGLPLPLLSLNSRPVGKERFTGLCWVCWPQNEAVSTASLRSMLAARRHNSQQPGAPAVPTNLFIALTLLLNENLSGVSLCACTSDDIFISYWQLCCSPGWWTLFYFLVWIYLMSCQHYCCWIWT